MMQLDDILQCLVENEMPVADITSRAAMTRTSVHRIETPALYRRIQAPPGGSGRQGHRKNFGRDRRYPITNRFRDRL